MNTKSIDKIIRLFTILNRIFAGFLALYIFSVGIYKGLISNSPSERITLIGLSFLASLLVIFTYVALEFGLLVWDKSTSWLSNQVRKFPHFRAWIIFPNFLFTIFSAYLVLKYLNTELSLRVFISIYLIWVLPAALISIVRDDLSKERAKLSKDVSREVRIQNPQAAVENAFTHFEDHLLKRLGGDSTLYSGRLIKAAYGKDKGQLVFKSDGKDYTESLYNLMSGAYSIFRNPRHHKVIEDDEQKAQAIISLAELLIELVDASQDRESQPENPLQNPAS